MIDLGPWFDDKPLMRYAVLIGAAFLGHYIAVGLATSNQSAREEIVEYKERSTDWSIDWRGRPYRELPVENDLSGASPTTFKIICRRDADGKVAHATLYDQDGIPGLEHLTVGDKVRVKMSRDNGVVSWRNTDTLWTLEKPGYLVSGNDIPLHLQSYSHHGGMASITLSDQPGLWVTLDLPTDGMTRASDEFFEGCKLPSFRPQFNRTQRGW